MTAGGLGTYLRKLNAAGQRELLLCAGRPPMSQSAGTLLPLPGEAAIDDATLRQLLRDALGPAELATLGARGMLDVVTACAEARLRCVCMQGEAGLTALVRMLPAEPLSCRALGVPDSVAAMAAESSGLVIVAAPAGGGKTTLLAALVEHINDHDRRFVLKIEERHELTHTHRLAVIAALRVGLQCDSVPHGIRAALTLDADVIVVDQLDAPGALAAAAEAASQGALVLGGVRAWNAAGAVEQLLGALPEDARARMRQALAETCVGMVAQELSTGKGGAITASRQLFVRSAALSSALREGKVAALAGLRA